MIFTFNFKRNLGDVFPIAIVSYTTTLSIGKLFAYKHKYRLDAMQEAFAAGISNICGSFLHCIPSAASLSRSALQEKFKIFVRRIKNFYNTATKATLKFSISKF